MNRLFIAMPDTIYVGRYYKLYALPMYGALENYSYVIDGTCIELVATDTIKVIGAGEVTITAKSTTETATKVISCEEYPELDRKVVEYVYDNAENFKAFIEGITEPTEVRFMADADMVIDDTINVPYGVLINFNFKNIKLGATVVESRSTFIFEHDHCGVINLKLYSIYPDWSQHTAGDKYTQAHTMFTVRGSFFRMENFVCVNRQNAGISVARWGSLTGSYYAKKNTWLEGKIAAGYIGETGEIVEDTNAWYSTEFVNLPDSGNGYFSVGYFGNFLQHSSKTYAIAFYDDEDEFLSVKYGLQFYKGYMRPDGAVKCKLMLWNPEEPAAIKVGESGGMDWNYYLYVTGTDNTREILFKNCRSMENESGMIDFTGDFQEVNIIECKSTSGKTNSWAIDFEDGWMGMKDVVIKSCLFTRPFIHSVQGMTILNTLLKNYTIASWANGVVLENVIGANMNNYGLITAQITVPVIFKNVKLKGARESTMENDDYSKCENSKYDPLIQYETSGIF